METNDQLQTIEGANIFVKNLSEECRKNLIEALDELENRKRYRIVVNERFIGGYVKELGCNATRKSKWPLGFYEVDRNAIGVDIDVPKIRSWSLSLDDAKRIITILERKRSKKENDIKTYTSLRDDAPRDIHGTTFYSYDYELSPGQK